MEGNPSFSNINNANPFSTQAASSSSLSHSSNAANGSSGSTGRGRGVTRARRAGSSSSASTRGSSAAGRGKSFANRSTVFNTTDTNAADVTSAFTGGPAEAAKRHSTHSELSASTQSLFGGAKNLSFTANGNARQGNDVDRDHGAAADDQPLVGSTLASGSSSAFSFAGQSTAATKAIEADTGSDDDGLPPHGSHLAKINALGGSAKEDEERKKRFENLPSQNRFFELKHERDALRARYIRQGILPDPDKPQDLSAAQRLRGTCQEMCPGFEREEREFQNEGDSLEMFPGTSRIDPQLAVKIYRRPAAGRELPLPEDVRPPAVLRRTLDYLVHTLLPDDPSSSQFTSVQPFMWNRTRAIRQDFIVQSERGALTIECHERIARYHILCLHWKGGVGAEGWSEQQELEQLRKTIRSLTEFYEDLRQSTGGRVSPNEAEFRAYNLLLHMHDPETLREAEMLPSQVFDAPSIQAALRLRAYAQRSNNVTRRGRPANTEATLNLWTRFFQELKRSEQVSYLLACLAENTFTLVRAGAAKAMGKAYQKMGVVPLDYLRRSLGMDSDEEAKAFCLALKGEEMLGPAGQLQGLKLYQASDDGTTLPKAPFSRSIVESKRRHWSCQDIIDGKASGAAPLLSQVDGEDLTLRHAAVNRPIIQDGGPRKTTLTRPVAPPPQLASTISPAIPTAKQTTDQATAPQQPVGRFTTTKDTIANTKPSSFLSAKAPSFEPTLKPQASTLRSAFGSSPFGSAAQMSKSAESHSAQPFSSAFASIPTSESTGKLIAPSLDSAPKEKPSATFQFGQAPATTTTMAPSSSKSVQWDAKPAVQNPITNFAFGDAKKEAKVEQKTVRFAPSKAATPEPVTSTPIFHPKLEPARVPSTSQSESTSSTDSMLRKGVERSSAPSVIKKEPQEIRPKRTVESVVAALSQLVMAEFVKQKVFAVSDQACRREERQRRKSQRNNFVEGLAAELYNEIEAEYVEETVWQAASGALAAEIKRRRMLASIMDKWLAALDAARERETQNRRLMEVRAELERRHIGSLSATIRSSDASASEASNQPISLRRSLAQSRAETSLRIDAAKELDPRSHRGIDEELRQALLRAEKARKELWKSNTFQDCVVSSLTKKILALQHVPDFTRWTLGLDTASAEKTSEWLHVKLGLLDGHAKTELALPLAGRRMSLAIVSLQRCSLPAWKGHLGMIIFEIDPELARRDIMSEESTKSKWEEQRKRLRKLSSSDEVQKSEFAPRLLILSWSSTVPTERERTRKIFFARLGLSAMEQERAAWTGGVAFAELGDQETSPPDVSFEAAVAELFSVNAQGLLRTGGTKKPELRELVAKVRAPWSNVVKVLQDVTLVRLRKVVSGMESQEACALTSKVFTVAVNLANVALQGLIDASEFVVEKEVVKHSRLFTLPMPPTLFPRTGLRDDVDVDELLRTEAVEQIDGMLNAREAHSDEEGEEEEGVADLQHDLSALELIRSLAWNSSKKAVASSSLSTEHVSRATNTDATFPMETHLERLFSYVATRLEEVWIGIEEQGREHDQPVGAYNNDGEERLTLLKGTVEEVEVLGQRAIAELEQMICQEAKVAAQRRQNSKKRGEESMSASPSSRAMASQEKIEDSSATSSTKTPPLKRKRVGFGGEASSSSSSPRLLVAKPSLSNVTATTTPTSVQSLRALMEDAKRLLSSSSSSSSS